ncbi:hypothetical protein [Campylobacter lanienae]|uniref:DNA polymerase IV n=1 Tax=Campylobacter lanienae TaxID=75658 RepID=A0ABY3G8W7_9BACT|nr:hypothetical protein [Campylobacter lanienae]TWO29159.1 DNA polymerase IV [Campylobacter lanienae]
MFIHIDLDAFFISAASTIDKSLIGKKAAVASGSKFDIFGDYQDIGIILSASYEARSVGIRCAMHANLAKKICPELILIPTDFNLYHNLSNQLYKLLLNYTDEIERYSIDECFVDLSGTKFDNNPLEFAKKLKFEINNILNLPCSIGIAPNKLLAKLATDLAKPSKIYQINSAYEVENLAISMLPGVGKSLYKNLSKYGISTIKDALYAGQIFDNLGKNALNLYNSLTLKYKDKIIKNQPKKSIAIARSFSPIKNRDEIDKRVMILCRHLYFSVVSQAMSPSKFELKIRYKSQEPSSASVSINEHFTHKLLEQKVREMLVNLDKFKEYEINYLSLCAAGFDKQKEITLFDNQNPKNSKISSAIIEIQKKYGIDAIKTLSEF